MAEGLSPSLISILVPYRLISAPRGFLNDSAIPKKASARRTCDLLSVQGRKLCVQTDSYSVVCIVVRRCDVTVRWIGPESCPFDVVCYLYHSAKNHVVCAEGYSMIRKWLPVL